MMKRTLWMLGTLTLTVGCGGLDPLAVDAADAPLTTPLSPQEEQGVLALVNDCVIGAATLDDDAALDKRAAFNIIGHRDGGDARCGSADDDRFDDLPELDAIPYVGDAAIARLLEFARARGYVQPGDDLIYVEGVPFSAEDMASVLELCNCAALAVLDDDVGLDARAAAGILAARPFADPDPAVNMARLAAVSYVGSNALQRLKGFALTWQGGCAPLGGTFDGVTFSDAQAQIALAVLNTASRGQLRTDVRYSKAITDHVITGRNWADLAAFAATSGIGPATMTTLRSFTDSGLWHGPGTMQTALSVAEVVARAAALQGQFVSFNRVLASSARVDGTTFEATVQDGAGSTTSARLYRQLCNPISEACVAAPAIAAGEEVELVWVRVDVTSGKPRLTLIDTSEVRALGCWEGWTRSCGMNVGVCSVGTETCAADRWATCTGLVDQLATDPQDGLDNDCDGRIDENSVEIRALGHLPDPVRALGLGGAGSIASNGQEMLRLDLSDPAHPAVLERLAQVDPGKPSIRVDDERAVMAACRSGTRVYDLPASGLTPSLSVPLTLTAASVGCVKDALQVGHRLYTVDCYNGVFGHDVSGSVPAQVLHIPLANPRALEVLGGYLIVLADALWVYDLDDTSAPVAGPFHGGSDLAINDDGLLAVADASGIYLYDARDPARLQPYPVFSAVPAETLDFDGDRLIAAPSSGGRVLSVLDVRDPVAPRVVAEVTVPNPNAVFLSSALDGVQLEGDVIYAYGGTGLHLFGVSLP
ncbi:MAG: hypothetical protein ABIJ09_07695 [Pseudomonadota bacterium]